MTDDDLLAEYLGAPTDDGRAEAARQLAARGIDPADFDFAFDELGDDIAWVDASQDLEDRIMAAVMDDVAAAATTTERPAPAAAPASVTSLADHRARRAAHKASRLITRVAAVAAAIALGIAIGRVRSAGPSFTMQAALSATPLAPDAAATLKARTENAGVRIELAATGLPDPGPGVIFEAWVTDGTIRIPIGTFSKAGNVVLWSGVSLEKYPIVTVTLEPEDGDAGSSGRVVLRGRVQAS